jgi:alpha-tubulin suppressor-like RCC1 family protein
MKKTLIGFLVLCFGISLLSSAQTAEAEMVQSNDDPYTYYEDMDFVQVSLGGSHSSAITSEGRIFTWGSNNYGQLGDGTTTRRYTPTDITGYFGLNSGETIVSVSLGLSHSTAITSEGRIFTWGRNQYGQLGDGSTTNRNTPTDITGQLDFNTGESITGVSLGAVHSSVVSSAGRLFTWGQNDYGQLGNGTTTYGSIPTDITGQFSLIAGETLTSVSLGSYHSSAITSGGRLFIWGQNSYGQLGNGTGTTLTTPTDITGHFNLIAGETITRVSLGFSHSSAITSEGRLFTWGFNNYGQLGDGTTTYKLNPTDIMGRFSLGSDETIVSISLGHSHSIAITSEGRLFTWGWNQYGQVGDGTTTDRYTPTEITSQFISYTGETITGVSLAGSLSSAITSEGRLFIWGQNDYGQLGDGTTSSSSVPKHIVSERLNILQSLLPVTEEIAKYNNSSPSAVLMTSGRLFTAGHNQYGNLGDGTTINTKHYVEITDNFHLGENEYIIDITSSNNGVLTSNGRIFTWGRNNEGQLGTGSKDFEPHPNPIDITSNFNLHDGESVVSLKSTSNTFGALTSEGRLFVWGNYCNETLFFFPTEINFQTELGEEERIKDFELTYVNWGLITSTGRVFTWGVNDRGQLGDGTVIDKTTPTEITDNFSLLPNEYVEQLFLSGSTSSAITSEGRIFTWGSNNYGQLGDGTTTNRTTPTEITNQFDLSEDDIIVQMNMGNSYSSALSLMGEVFTWGLNYYGELGNGTYSNWNPNPNPINITSNFDLYETDNITIISGGSRPSGAVSSRGILYGWGYNGDGRLLDGTTQDRYIPHPINQIIDTSNAILKTDVGESVNHLSDHIKVSMVFHMIQPILMYHMGELKYS